MIISHERPIGSLAAADARAAALLFARGLDPARHGALTLKEACTASGMDPTELVKELDRATRQPAYIHDDPNMWDLDRLVNHIERKHHAYVRERVPILNDFLRRLSARHGHKHPELFAISILFASMSADLLTHLDTEEQVLFPYIRELALAARNNQCVLPGSFGTVRHPVRSLLSDHKRESDRLNRITELTCDHVLPPEADSTYVGTYQLLKEFGKDLQWHVHLEANILFPRAMDLERPAAPWHPLSDAPDELR